MECFVLLMFAIGEPLTAEGAENSRRGRGEEPIPVNVS